MGAAVSPFPNLQIHITTQTERGFEDLDPCSPNTHMRSSASLSRLLWQGFAWRTSLPSPSFHARLRNHIHSNTLPLYVHDSLQSRVVLGCKEFYLTQPKYITFPSNPHFQRQYTQTHKSNAWVTHSRKAILALYKPKARRLRSHGDVTPHNLPHKHYSQHFSIYQFTSSIKAM